MGREDKGNQELRVNKEKSSRWRPGHVALIGPFTAH